MLIEHTTKRPNGSIHSIGGVKYHFEPTADGAHVAEVETPAHIQRFLSIPSFTVYDPNAPVEPVVQAAPVAPAATTDAPTGDEGDEDAPTPLEDAPDEVLDQLYEDAYGKKPHHKVKRDKIIDMIRKAPAKEAE
ncbi:hypothetical protein [Yoonia sp.]|uniref:hypothetical protein n=1 Tax=Yoonia sp. TaxID=2212373 RepID=UPI002DFF4228|nr:hypothetical protein [Yoonia sp.]